MQAKQPPSETTGLSSQQRRDAEGLTVLVYQYGCRHRADLDEAMMDQLRIANELRNSLVEAEAEHARRIAAAWTDHPSTAVARLRVDEATAAVDALSAQALIERQQDRSTKPRPETKLALANARRARSEAKMELKAAKHAAEGLAPLFAALKLECRACQVRKTTMADSLYKEYVQKRGLAWGTFNDIAARWCETVARRNKARANGDHAEERFHRFTGEGRITVQVQRDQHGNRRPVWSLEGEGKHRTLRLQVRTRHPLGPLTLELPIVFHRPLPDRADVSEIRVIRRRVASHARLFVSFTCRVPKPATKTIGEAVDVDFGWASGGKGVGLRVALISTGSGTLPSPPAEIADMVTVGDWYEVWVPARWRDFAGRPEAIKAHRAELCDNIRDTVVAALSADDVLAEKVGYTASAVSRWKSERRFSRLAREWPQGHELWPELELWRQRDKHLWEFEANERDQIIARRNDLYRKIAAWVADSARVIAIKDVAITNVKRKPVLGEEDTYQARGGRKQIQFAAPGTLREHLVSAAAARGVTVLTYSSETTSEDGND